MPAISSAITTKLAGEKEMGVTLLMGACAANTSACIAGRAAKRTAWGAKCVVLQVIAVGAMAATAVPAMDQPPAALSYHRHCGTAEVRGQAYVTVAPAMPAPHTNVRAPNAAPQSTLRT